MSIETVPFDAADHLKTEQDQVDFIADALQEGDPAYVAHALGIVARARGMADVAKGAGITREALYRALSATGDPKLSTVLGVTKALGIKLTVAA